MPQAEPIVLFWLSRMLGQPFNYLTTRESLDGPRGRLLNNIDAYSVIRGFPDRQSLRMSRQLLAELDREVVIFPEGQVYEHNDRLLTFQSGVAQIGFWAVEDLQKAGREPFLPILPIAVKYRCCGPHELILTRGLLDLERTLGLLPASGLSRYQRLRRVGCKVLARLEHEEGIREDEAADLSERIGVVRRGVLQRVARSVGTKLDEQAAPAEQLHALFNQLKAWVGVLGDEDNEYDERRYLHRLQVAGPLFKELLRLQNFIVITGNYVAAQPTAERFNEVLGCLQTEVFGRVRHRVHLAAMIRIAPPILLHERYGEYRQSKRDVVADVTRKMQRAISERLEEMSAEATPISLDW